MNKKKFKFLYFNYYLCEISFKSKGPIVALITAEGPIHVGKGQRPGFHEPTIGNETLVKAIEAAAEDKKVRAILLRVNSPGGSYVGSDHIAQAIIKARAKGKKIIVSMSNVAASGGYYISHNSDVIVANPLTLTGSIGVVAGKLNARKLYEEHLGITFDGVKEGDRSDLFSQLDGMSEGNEKKFNELLDDIYSDFKGKVVEGRKNPNLTHENIDEVARGRVWVGHRAKENHLVDHMGGFITAINITKQQLGLEEKDSISLKEYPKKPSWIKLILSSGGKKNSRDSQDSLSISNAPKMLLELFGYNFIQTAIIRNIYNFLGIQMVYNPMTCIELFSTSQVHLLAPNYSFTQND